MFDKTGTLTVGRPEVARVLASPPWTSDEVLRSAAGVEHGSSHLLARTLVDAAKARGIETPEASDITEAAGQGVWGRVESRLVTVGGRSFVLGRSPDAAAAFLRLLESARPKSSEPS